MKHILSFYYSIHHSFCQALAVLAILAASVISPIFSTPASAASANNFYFEDATFDYYLEPTDTGSKMHVKEVLTAIFPETNQNHGITRAIPFSNLDGKNITVPNENALNLTVLRNGEPENVSKIEKDEDEYIAYIGSASSYVHGRQVYTLEYDFQNVISEFTDTITTQPNCIKAPCPEENIKTTFQELYWDTNGTGWSQNFKQLTATVHLPKNIAKNVIEDRTSCYVGSYGKSDSCNFSRYDTTDETEIVFYASNLSARENLTFAIDFEAGTFVVPALPLNWTYVIATIVIALICGLTLFVIFYRYFKKVHPKKVYYKGLFVAPQYAPSKDYHVAEAGELYLKTAEKSYVATLLELAVSGKISIIKGEPSKILKKDSWEVQVNNLDNISESQEDLLRILTGGSKPEVGEKIKIKKHTATASLAALSRSYTTDAISKLKKLGLFEKSSGFSGSSAGVIIFILVMFIGIFSINGFAIGFSFLETLTTNNGVVVGETVLPLVCAAIIIVTVLTSIIISVISKKYKKYTTSGLDAANYLDGLYLYIKMAESDRIKFLQSVKGANTSKKGIVKLYEKLLPYACLFGLEESWMEELGKYCQEINYNPDWYNGSISDFATFTAINSIVSSVNSSVSASTSYSNSSSGSSSFSSGGGGGGFSGGGGGGGGGGGW